MKNYIEYTHQFRKPSTFRGKPWVDDERLVFWAVRPTPDEWRDAESEPELDAADWEQSMQSGWILLGGQGVHVYTKEDVAALRGLLDEIEKEMES